MWINSANGQSYLAVCDWGKHMGKWLKSFFNPSLQFELTFLMICKHRNDGCGAIWVSGSTFLRPYFNPLIYKILFSCSTIPPKKCIYCFQKPWKQKKAWRQKSVDSIFKCFKLWEFHVNYLKYAQAHTIVSVLWHSVLFII